MITPVNLISKKIDYNLNDRARISWHRLLKEKSDASDVIKLAMNNLISTEIIPGAIATNAIDLF